jgi:hypothetical protein
MNAICSRHWPLTVAILCVWVGQAGLAEEPPPKTEQLHGLPLLLAEDFEKGADRWQPTDREAWRVSEGRGGKVYDQFVKHSKYEPPHRSPFNFALLKDAAVGDFALTAKVRSTVADYGHRDACVIFGYQDKAHFYYVHLGKKTDDHANQIFIVNDKPRTKISTKTTAGTPWDDEWHDVKIVRRVKEGTIEVFFDDMKTPVMTATDKTFTAGQIGLGTFDDTSQWDEVKLYGQRAVAAKR